jgi:DNA-binding transcriptional regulator of glucitol operon
MSFVTVFILFAVGAYIVQALLGILQIKHFNRVYRELRNQGKVAIGRRPGKFRAGTLALFAIEEDGKIIDMRLMQGVTVLSKFKQKAEYIGHDLHYIDSYHPLVQKENKLTQEAMENAREVYLKVSTGNYKEEPAPTPFQQVGHTISWSVNNIKNKIRGSV